MGDPIGITNSPPYPHLAQIGRIEQPSSVLETPVLPLNYTCMCGEHPHLYAFGFLGLYKRLPNNFYINFASWHTNFVVRGSYYWV